MKHTLRIGAPTCLQTSKVTLGAYNIPKHNYLAMMSIGLPRGGRLLKDLQCHWRISRLLIHVVVMMTSLEDYKLLEKWLQPYWIQMCMLKRKGEWSWAFRCSTKVWGGGGGHFWPFGPYFFANKGGRAPPLPPLHETESQISCQIPDMEENACFKGDFLCLSTFLVTAAEL